MLKRLLPILNNPFTLAKNKGTNSEIIPQQMKTLKGILIQMNTPNIHLANTFCRFYFSQSKRPIDQLKFMQKQENLRKMEDQTKNLDIKNPKNHHAFLRKVSYYGSIGQHQKQIALIKQIINSNPERQMQILCYLSLGIACKSNSQFQTALDYLRKVQEEAPKYPKLYPFYTTMANILESQKKFKQAVKYNQIAYYMRPTDPMSICKVGQSYYHARQFDKLQQLTKKAVSDFPTTSIVLAIFGQMKSKLGKLTEANQLYDKALQIDANQETIYVLKLQSLINHRKIQQALKYYNKICVQRPKLKNMVKFAYFGGLLLHELRFFEEAIAQLLKVTIDFDGFAAAQHMLGNCYLDLMKYEEAYVHYQKATKVNRNMGPSFIGLGTCQYAKGNKEKAIQYYDKAISIQSNSFDAHIRKGTVCHEIDRFEEAITHYKKAIELNPNHVQTWLNLGHCMVKTNSIAEAVNCYDKFLVSDPENRLCLANKSFCLVILRRYSEAKLILEKIISEFPTFQNYYNLAVCHRMFYDLDKAEACLKKALQIQPGRSQAITAVLQIQQLKKKDSI